MIKIKLDRHYREKQTLGSAYIEGDEGNILFSFKTLELPWRGNERNISCIPEGTYKVVRRHSQKYKDHLWITGVEGRSLILIHWGNYAGSINPRTGTPDIRGCILVGSKYGDINGDGITDILSSKPTFKALMHIVPEEMELEICGNGYYTNPDV
tara:strand:+ start:4016 stop:4477 length:462 start_codon:yes stop_codon:yes gene_type:complete